MCIRDRVYIAIDLSKTKAQFIVRDQGNGFDADQITGNSDTGHISELGKRGLTLIQNFMDECTFNEEGNEIRMSLKIPR